MSDLEKYLESAAQGVAEELIRIYSHSDEALQNGLTFPRTRNGSLRISEQESKLLFARRFTVDEQFSFSVETPTVKTYRQSGTTDMSARIDLTLMGSDGRRSANIELKAHDSCSIESIRKDLEKLIREDTLGLWFHTLERDDGRRLERLLSTFRKAFELVSGHIGRTENSLLICFCVLDSGKLYWRWLRFKGDAQRSLVEIRNVLEARSIASGQWPIQSFGDQLRRRPSTASELNRLRRSSNGKGARGGFFVLAPSIAGDTFLHLSARGGSYRIRNFFGAGPSVSPPALTVPGYASLEALRSSCVIVRWIPVTTEDLSHNVVNEPGYWYERIRDVNAQELPATDE